MSYKVAINGFGRIGRLFFRQAFEDKDIDIVAINDLGDLENLAYLLKYDTVYGRYDKSVEVKGDKLVVRGSLTRAGRTISACTANAYTVTDGRSEHVSMMMSTVMCLENRNIRD